MRKFYVNQAAWMSFFIIAVLFILSACFENVPPNGASESSEEPGSSGFGTELVMQPAARDVVLAKDKADWGHISLSTAPPQITETTAAVTATEPSAEAGDLPGAETKTEPETETETEPETETHSQYSQAERDAMSKEKIGWGAKHNGHEQPEIAAATRALFQKYNTIYAGNPEEPILYLTFDEGYENGYTGQILDTLLENEVKAVFFVTGHYLNTQPGLIERMIREGHVVGNHSQKHTSFPDDTQSKLEEEILGLEQAYAAQIERTMPKLVRPPAGEYSEWSLAMTAQLGYRSVLWSFAYVDYDEKQARGTAYAYQMITDNLHNGAIILLHAESKENAQVLGRVLQTAKTAGYRFETLDAFR